MKKLLKKFLNKRHYEELRIKKNKFVDLVNYILFKILTILPTTTLLYIKAHIKIIKKLDYVKKEIFLQVDSPGIEYRVRPNSCAKEPETIYWIEKFLKEGDVFYDIGANVGAYSLVASKFLNGNVKIYSFEPAFLNYTQLCKNIFINKCQNSITPIQIPLSDRTVIDKFYYSSLESGDSLHVFGAPIDYRGLVFESVSTQNVLSYRLDDLIKNFNLENPNHIKLDVDGLELKILQGANDIFLNSSLRSIIVELNEELDVSKSIINFLISKGFNIHSEHYHKTTYNCIFLR